ncbi:MAG: FAD-binding oxidoreductase, partial [Flavobacteriales bacterium]
MVFQRVDGAFIERLRHAIGNGDVLVSQEDLEHYGHDETEDLVHPPEVVVQPGVITQVLQEAVASKGLYYPPDPSSRGSCTIGGNLAENAGGP